MSAKRDAGAASLAINEGAAIDRILFEGYPQLGLDGP